MRILCAALAAWVAASAAGSNVAIGNEWSGYVSAEGRYFFNSPLFAGQEDHNGSIAIQPEYYHEWEDGSNFLFVPFARLDSADSERTHFDIRELYIHWVFDVMEIRAGVARVFWGATEFVHLVDVINQTDLVEHVDGEDKLGQPLIQASFPRAWGTIDFFILPYFRERTFPGVEGRLRPERLIDTSRTVYQNANEQSGMDVAIRYNRSAGPVDFGIYYFKGTNREPRLFPTVNEANEPILVPFYERIDQFGLDATLVAGEWLWKLEALYRAGYEYDGFAAVGGLEYTFYGIAGTEADLGLVTEYIYDKRGEVVTPFDNDVMFGFRLTPNDAASTQLLVGWFEDLDGNGRACTIEASRRFGANWKLILEAWTFFGLAEDTVFYDLRDDDFVRLELAYYF